MPRWLKGTRTEFRPEYDLPGMKALVHVLELTENPSSAFYVLPVAMRLAEKVVRLSLQDVPPREIPPGTSLIIVRYLNQRWRRWITANRAKFARLVLFLDDDIFDPTAWHSLPLGYRFKAWRLCARHLEWFRRVNIELWVSTPYLADKYHAWTPRLCLPSDIKGSPAIDSQSPLHRRTSGRIHHKDCRSRGNDQLVGTRIAPSTSHSIRVFYHGSSTHYSELVWLRDIAMQAGQLNPALTFELIGNRSVQRLWRGVSNTRVVPEMTWPQYLEFTFSSQRDIGLAPLLPHPFNAARSHTKFFDITRTGAAGIYSDHPAFVSALADGRCGTIVRNDPESWVEAILALAFDHERRNTIANAARRRVDLLSHDAMIRNSSLLERQNASQS